MPANRSRTMQWKRCLRQVHERGGAIEIAVDRPYAQDEHGSHLIWRVRVVSLSEQEIVVEQPTALGESIKIAAGMRLVGGITVGQNRWMFTTENLGSIEVAGQRDRKITALRLTMPTEVQRCQRRNHHRIESASLQLPRLELWPLLDPKSVVVAERASELAFEEGGGPVAGAQPDMLPEVGPKFPALLLNLGGGGVGIRVAPDHGQLLVRHKLFWTRLSLPPELTSPICATAKLIHTHMQSDHQVYAGLAFDFSFNAGHQRLVVKQIRQFIDKQQQQQMSDAPAERRSA